MIKIQTIDQPDNILREDLSGIVSDHKALAPYLVTMRELCHFAGGVGLAANQVGLRENFFYAAREAKFPSKRGNPSEHLCINPTWKPAAAKQVASTEGCLSIPRIKALVPRNFVVPRYDVIEAEWTNAVGHRIRMKLRDLAAFVFQHEHDHLRGVTLIESGTPKTLE